MISDISELRNEYKKRSLNKKDLHQNPIYQFEKWLTEAIDSQIYEPTAMTLASVDIKGRPSARIVLLKFVDENGFSFFTNYYSRKGKELEENPNAALVFYWPELERQVRVRGSVSKLNEEISDKYFNSRPKESRISAIISPQSMVVPDRKFLEEKAAEFISFQKEIKRPKNWGGYVLSPAEVEFWQGRENRLHDRFLYEKNEENWEVKRLAP